MTEATSSESWASGDTLRTENGARENFPSALGVLCHREAAVVVSSYTPLGVLCHFVKIVCFSGV